MLVSVGVVGFGRSYRVTFLADPFLTSIAEVIRLRLPIADVTVFSVVRITHVRTPAHAVAG
jgi:hypothetical protein